MAKYTNEDIKSIARQMREKRHNKKPFNLLTGAGTSKSAGIPLAGEFVEKIHARYGEDCKKLKGKDLNDYGLCMACLSENERRQLIEPYLKGSKINWAHIAIASMMHAGYVSRVITFNFDSVLARACGLLGLYPATYDFAAAATVDTDYIADQAIIHLHGQGSGRVLLNTNAETKKHTKNIKPLIHATLKDHSLLVIGYSGGSDAVFSLLRKEYTGRERIWWAGHSESPNAEIEKLIKKYENNANYIGGCDADEFLIVLARELNCFPPTLFKNPFKHLLEELEPVTEFPITERESVDLLNNTRQKLKSGSDEENKRKISLDELIMQGNWQAVIDNGDTSDPEQKDKVAWAYFMLANQFAEAENTKVNKAYFDLAFNEFEKAIKIKPNFCEAYNNWGITLAEKAELEKDVSLYEKSFEKFKLSIVIKPNQSQIYNNWGTALCKLAKQKKDNDLFKESFEKYKCALTIKHDACDVYYNWAIGLAEQAKLNSDPSLYKQSFIKYEKTLELNPNYYQAYYNWGLGLSELAILTSDERLYEESIIKYKRTVEINQNWYGAYINWGISLKALADMRSDFLLYEESCDKYNQALIIKPNFYDAYVLLGDSLFFMAKIKSNDSLFISSYEKYEHAISIDPGHIGVSDVYRMLGNVLAERAKLVLSKELCELSIKKFEQSEKANPNDYDTYNDWSIMLLNAYRWFKDKKFIDLIFSVLEKAEKIDPYQAYNFACYYSQIKDYKNCKEKLEICKQHNTLPSKAHLLTDEDLENIRGEEWFTELIQDLK